METSSNINKRLFTDTSSNTLNVLFIFAYPSTNKFPATSNEYKYPFSSIETFL